MIFGLFQWACGLFLQKKDRIISAPPYGEILQFYQKKIYMAFLNQLISYSYSLKIVEYHDDNLPF